MVIKNKVRRVRENTDRVSVFHCSMCGECCSSVTIPVEKEKAERLLEKDWFRSRLNLFKRELLGIDKNYYRMPLRDDQYCVFLGDDNRCLIEVNEGEAAKPEECKRFPFARVELPDNGVAYDTSAVCKTVAEDLLAQFAPIIPQPGREPPTRDPATDDTPLPAKIRAHGRVTIDAADYDRYCTRVWAIFANPSLAPETALKQLQAVVLALPDEPRNWPETAELSPFWARLLPLFLLRKPYGPYSTLELAQGVMGGGSYHDPKVFGPDGVDLAALAGVSVSPETELQRGFLANVLTRKVLLTYGHSLESILSMTCAALVLLNWYARVLAAVAGKNSPGNAETALAIRLVERYYTGHQPQFPERFRTHFFWKRLHKRVLK